MYYCYSSFIIEPDHLPTIQCYTCCRFDHVKGKRRSIPRCFKCGQMRTGNICTTSIENAYCCLCSGQHFATDKNCLEHSWQKAIKKKLSEDNISYSEAATLLPPSYRSFSDVARTMFSPTYPLPTHSFQRLSRDGNPMLTSDPQSTSYRRTMRPSPRHWSPLTPGYYRVAHQALVSQ